MLYIDVPLADWLERHKLESTMERCENCGQLYTLDVPIVIKGYAGLEMQKHGCPDNFLSATFTPTCEKEKGLWSKVFVKLTGY